MENKKLEIAQDLISCYNEKKDIEYIVKILINPINQVTINTRNGVCYNTTDEDFCQVVQECSLSFYDYKYLEVIKKIDELESKINI